MPGYAESIVASAPLAVFPSSEATLANGRARGFAGCISATVNISAPLAAAVWRGAASDPGRSARDQEQLGEIRAAIAAYPLVPALRGVLASLLGDPAWKRMMPPLHVLPAADETALAARLASVPAFAVVREAFACA